MDISVCLKFFCFPKQIDCYLRDAGQIKICETWSLLFSAFFKFEKEKEKSVLQTFSFTKLSLFFYYSDTERLIFKYFSLAK